MTLKERYQQFKAWQLNPREWSVDEHETHHCVNCGRDFVGNYCPCCSQKAGDDKISWKSVLKSSAEVWGVHNRSLLYSLWQLAFRPGYLISDYINGKKQVSFPPVKMLVVVGVFSVVVDHFFRSQALLKPAVKVKDGSPLLNQFDNWLDSSPGWGTLILAFFFLIPTWLLFRYAPRNAKHTLPQGFFIQVFMAIIALVVDDLYDLTAIDYFLLLIPICYFISYWQLFGYRFWGNLWRVLIVMFSSFMMMVAVMIIIEMLTIDKAYSGEDYFVLTNFLLMATVPVVLGCLIGKIRYQRRAKKKAAEEEDITDNTSETCMDGSCQSE